MTNTALKKQSSLKPTSLDQQCYKVYTEAEKSLKLLLQRVSKRQIGQRVHGIPSIRIGRDRNGNKTVNERKELRFGQIVLRPLKSGGAVWVEVDSESNEVVRHSASSIDVQDIRTMEL